MAWAGAVAEKTTAPTPSKAMAMSLRMAIFSFLQLNPKTCGSQVH
jgi:hypothetical protein